MFDTRLDSGSWSVWVWHCTSFVSCWMYCTTAPTQYLSHPQKQSTGPESRGWLPSSIFSSCHSVGSIPSTWTDGQSSLHSTYLHEIYSPDSILFSDFTPVQTISRPFHHHTITSHALVSPTQKREPNNSVNVSEVWSERAIELQNLMSLRKCNTSSEQY